MNAEAKTKLHDNYKMLLTLYQIKAKHHYFTDTI